MVVRVERPLLATQFVKLNVPLEGECCLSALVLMSRQADQGK